VEAAEFYIDRVHSQKRSPAQMKDLIETALAEKETDEPLSLEHRMIAAEIVSRNRSLLREVVKETAGWRDSRAEENLRKLEEQADVIDFCRHDKGHRHAGPKVRFRIRARFERVSK
jgi:hypothetical protein